MPDYYNQDVDGLLGDTVSAQVLEKLEDSTKEDVGRLIDYYAKSGYGEDAIVQVLDEKLGSTDIDKADADQITEAVEELVKPLKESVPTETPVGTAPVETATPTATAEPTMEQIMEELVAAAGKDIDEAFAKLMPDLPATVVKSVWAEVKEVIADEVADDPEKWADKDAVRTASYYALWEALTGFMEASAAAGFPMPTAEQ